MYRELARLAREENAEVLGRLDVKLLRFRDGRPECRDPWGRPVRYVTSRITSPDLRRRVSRHGGAIFESAGPDSRFGPPGDAAAADDLRTDEPGM